MADNGFTEGFADGVALTQSQLETSFKSLKLDIANTTQMTVGSTTGQFLKSNGDGAAASFASVPDSLSPSAARNYGITAIASAGALVIRLKTNAGADASSSDKINICFSNNQASASTYSQVDVTGALSLSVTASATLGFTSTATNRVFVYAINNGGTAKLAVSARSDFDQGAAVTTTAMSADADSATALYATATLTVVPRLLGWTETTLNSSKQWQSPSKTNVTNTETSPIAGYIRSTGTTVGVAGVALSASSGSFTSSSATFVDVTNLSVTITSTGRPIHVGLIADGSTSASWVGGNNGVGTVIAFEYRLLRGATGIAIQAFDSDGDPVRHPSSMLYHVDMPVAGTYTYKLQARRDTGTCEVRNSKLIAYEF